MPLGVFSALLSALPWPSSTTPVSRDSRLTPTREGRLALIDKQPERAQQMRKADSEPHLTNASVDERVLAALLTHFEKPGMSPPSARMRAVVLHEQHQAARKLGSLAYQLGAALASKAIELAMDSVAYSLWGPRRPSWGLRMTLLSSVMRDANRHSGLMDIATMRMFLSLGNFAPLPHAAHIEQFTFRVRKRQLRGILAEHDAAEDGSRELAGEWVDAHAGGKTDERVIFYLHGGAYYLFSPATHRRITVPLSRTVGARVFAVDYRLAPETRFPGPLHDAVSAYLRLVEDLHVAPSRIILGGDSAGGGLSLALLLYLRDNGYPPPAGALLMSPWVDLTLSCDSWERNEPFDIVPRPVPGDPLDPIACYLGHEHVETLLTHPYASPLFGSLHGLPPLLVQNGEAEVLRDEAALFVHKARRTGVRVAHEVYRDQIHVFQAFSFLPASQHAFVAAKRWIDALVPPKGQSAVPYGINSSARDASVENARTLICSSDEDTCIAEAQLTSKRRPQTSRRSSAHKYTASLPSRRGQSHPDVAMLWVLANGSSGSLPLGGRAMDGSHKRRSTVSLPHTFVPPYALRS